MKVSRWKRYDPKSGLWISTGKSNFFYWYRFLQIAIEEGRVIDWNRYDGWGDVDYIKDTKFDVWWKKHWKELFSYREGDAPRFKLNTDKPQSEGMRYSLRLYEMKDEEGIEGNTWELAKRFALNEYPKRRYKQSKNPKYDKDAWSFHYARRQPALELKGKSQKQFAREKRQVQSKVSRYLSQAELMLSNVCVGRFPK